MTLLQAIILGAVQGLTEFIPISSSGHLLLISWLLGWSPPPLVFDVAVHWGTVLSVLAYFWRDWYALVRAGLNAVRRRSLADPQAQLLAWVLVTAVPAMLIGYLFESFFARTFAAPLAAAVFLVVTGVLLTLGDLLARAERGIDAMNWCTSLAIGLAQAVAILPGISRSGATIAVGRWRGLSREAAARFSFLLATPTILGAALYELATQAVVGTLAPQILPLLGGLVTATVTGYACIRWLMGYLRRGSLLPFAIYCAVVGTGWLALAAALGRL